MKTSDRWSKGGSVTLKVALVSFAFMLGVISVYAAICRINTKNELLRRERQVSSNILSMYDGYMFNNFGLCVYTGIDVSKIARMQFDEPKFQGLEHRSDVTATIGDHEQLLMQAKNVVLVRLAKAAVDEAIKLSGIEEKYSEIGNRELDEQSEYDSLKEMVSDDVDLDELVRGMIPKMRGKSGNLDRAMLYATESKAQSVLHLVKSEKGSVKVTERDSSLLSDRAVLSEYAMGVMSDRVESKKRETDFYPESSRSEAFNMGEVEYIITGDRNVKTSQLNVWSRIYAIRAGVRTVKTLTDDVLMTEIKTASVVVSGFTAGAVPPPAVEAAIVFGIVVSAANDDMNELMEGNGVELVNTENKSLHTYYDDYLRLFLITLDSATMIERILDVMSSAYKADVSADADIRKGVTSHQITVMKDGKEMLKIHGGYIPED